MNRRLVSFAALAAAALLVVGMRIGAVHAVAFNWDELALFHRVARSVDTGEFLAGGHAGLTDVVLAPLIAGCDDEVEAGRRARLVWLGITFAYLAGIAALVLELRRGRPKRRHDAALAVALLGLLPVFLDWSLQVRTDHLAAAGGTWGGVALLASRRRPLLAALAGVAFGLGFLSSQKLAYVAGLMGALVLLSSLRERPWPWRRELQRGLGLAVGAGVTLLGFRAALRRGFEVAESHSATGVPTPEVVENYLDIFEFYRHTIGWGQYADLAPSLLPHAILGLGLVCASVWAWRRRDASAGFDVALVWGVLAVGLAVALFHAAAFSYFWITLGLFPALAGALALDPLRRATRDWRAAHPRLAGAALAALWLALTLPAGFETRELLKDSQSVQRESLSFIHRNFAPEDAGFHPETGLFCGEQPQSRQPFGIWFSQRIFRTFARDEDGRNADAFMRRFRAYPVHFLVESFRLNQFPPAVREFWAKNYQPYRGSVFVAGRRLAGEPGSDADFDLVVSARYRWLPLNGPTRVEIDGRIVEPGEVLWLDADAHRARFSAEAGEGMLVLAVGEPPGPAPLAFYRPN